MSARLFSCFNGGELVRWWCCGCWVVEKMHLRVGRYTCAVKFPFWNSGSDRG